MKEDLLYTTFETTSFYIWIGSYANGLSPNGLLNGGGSSIPFLPPGPLGGGLGGVSVIITSVMELSRAILVISGLV